MADTARLNTGRSSEFADSASGSGLTLTFAEVNYTGGIEGFGAIADVTGVTLSFTLSVAGPVQFFASGASLANPFVQGNFLGLAVNVNGTDYFGNGTGEQGFNSAGGGNLVTSGFTSGNAISFQKALNLSAGSYTVKLRAFGSGYLESSASFPTRLTVVYPVVTGTAAPASPLTKQEVGPFTQTLPGGSGPTLVPGATITVVLSAPQTIIATTYGTLNDPGNNRDDGQLIIRTTTPGPVTTDYLGPTAKSGNDVNSTATGFTRAISLPSGTSTIQLFHDDTGVTSELQDAWLTVIYTVPQAVQPAPFSLYQTAVRTAGDLTISATSLTDLTGPIEITANTNGSDVIIEVSAFAHNNSSNIIGLGLKIDGVEQSNISGSDVGITPMGSGGSDVRGSVGFKWLATGLAAGTHTFRLTAAVSSGNTTLFASTQRPLRMIVWYN